MANKVEKADVPCYTESPRFSAMRKPPGCPTYFSFKRTCLPDLCEQADSLITEGVGNVNNQPSGSNPSMLNRRLSEQTHNTATLEFRGRQKVIFRYFFVLVFVS